MKKKLIMLSFLLTGICTGIDAQEAKNFYTEKWSDNIFVGVGIGAMSTLNDGLYPTFNFNISLGKYITPTWGVRAQISGLWQKLDEQKTTFKGNTKSFAELNFDAILNVTNLLGGYNADRIVDFYLFAGPTTNFAKAVNSNVTLTTDGNPKYVIFEEEGLKTRIGATAGLGLGFCVNKKWTVNLESRFGVTPSIFGDASENSKAEGTARLTIGATYTFGGKKFIKGREGKKTIEKTIEKETIKEVPIEVIKEIVKEVPSAASAAIFFKVGKAIISEEGMVNIKLMAKVMKNNPNTKYKVAGFADRGTGSVENNQVLSEKRAQAVLDALTAEGIDPDRLEKIAMGGTEPMFEKAHLNRVVILEVK